MKIRNRVISCVLALCLCLTLCPAAFAESDPEPVTPTPPDWMPEEYYLVFPGDEVYLPENWAKVLEMRTDAANGGTLSQEVLDQPYTGLTGSAGMRYEIALVRLRCADNMTGKAAQRAFAGAASAFRSASENWKDANGGMKDALYHELRLWYERVYLLKDDEILLSHSESCNYVDDALRFLGMTAEDLFDAPYMDRVPAERRAQWARAMSAYTHRATVYLDGMRVSYSADRNSPPMIVNGRTMIPLRMMAEHLGADVDWDQATKKVTLVRAGITIQMTVGSRTAYVNGEPLEMNVAPYIEDGRTMIPVRYMSEFFGQKVTWDGEKHIAYVEEDKSVAGDSNLEAWALPMGAILSYLDGGKPSWFGLYERNTELRDPEYPNFLVAARPTKVCRYILRNSWGIESREDLIQTVCAMTTGGHNVSFRETAAYIASLTPAEYEEYVSAGWINYYMVPFTKQLNEKWGDRGILCWDLFRMSNLVQWGYTAGYITYAEALALLEPAAKLLSENFTSWDEAYENYLDGYHWWGREYALDVDVWETERGAKYQKLKQDDRYSAVFDDTLFQTGVVSVPGVTAQQLLEEALANSK